MKIEYDPDIPASLRPSIKDVIRDSGIKQCECGCEEIYVSLQSENMLDVKCYDCGKSFFELEVEIENETAESG